MDAAAQVHAAFALVHRADLQGPGEVVLSAWCQSMDLCAAVTSDGQLAVHRMNWQLLWALAPEAPVTALAWRPDGKLLATGHADGGLAVWDVETGEAVVRHARAHFAPVAALDWSLTPLSARIDHDDDRWAAGTSAAAAATGSGAGADADAPSRVFSAATSAATAAAYEDRQARLFPPDGLVLMTPAGGGGGGTGYGGGGGGGSSNKEDPYAELFRGAPPPAAAAARGDAAGAGSNNDNNHGPAAATWEVLPPADAPVSCPPLDLLCAADRRGCLSAWIGAGRVQVGDVAGLAPRVAAVAAAAANGADGDDDGGEQAAPPAPPPAATLVALSTAADQSACVSVAWHPAAPAATAATGSSSSNSSGGGSYRDGLVAAPLATRPLRAARREVRQWARLHWRLRGLLESADLALKAAAREWASASSTLRKRVLDELAEALAAHDDVDGGDDDQDGDKNDADHDNDADKAAAAVKRQDPRGDLMLLLATGAAGPGVHAWLTASLGEAGVQRTARAVDAALERAHALLLRSCLPALERAAFCLGELRGLAAACCSAAGPGGRGALLGLSAAALEPLEAGAVRAVVRAEQVRLAVGDLAACHRALFTWLLRTVRQLESASAAASAAAGGDNAADNAAAAAALLNRPPPEPPTGPDAALSDVLLPFLDEGGPLACDPLSAELGQRDAPLDAVQLRAAQRWLHGGAEGGATGAAEGTAAAARHDGGSGASQAALGPEEVVARVLRMLYPPERPDAAAAVAMMMGGGAFGAGDAGGGANGNGPNSPLSLAGQVAALAEACDEALAAPQSSVSARLTVGAPVCLAPAAALCPSSAATAGPSAAQPPPPPLPRVSVAPAGDGRQEDDGAGDNNDDDGGWSPDDGVVICVVVPAAGLAAIAPPEDVDQDAAATADGVLVVRARAVPAAASAASPSSPAAPTPTQGPPRLELRLSAVLVRGDPGARVVDAAPYKGGQLAVLSSAAVGAGLGEREEEGEEAEGGERAARSAAAAAALQRQQQQLQQQQPHPPPILALLDLSSAPFVDVSVSTSSTTTPTTTTALEACLALGAVVGAADLAAAGAVRAARLAGFAAAVAPLAVSRARGLALVLSDMQRLAVLDVDADEEGADEEED